MKSILRATVSIVGVSGILTACSLDRIVNVDEPQLGTDVDHEYLDTKAGALALLHSSLGSLQFAVSKASLDVGAFTDELTSRPSNSPDYYYFSQISSDTRFEAADYYGLKGVQSTAYPALQAARTKAGHARYFLRRRADTTLNYAISAAYSFEGYAITMLAENLCSGVPLSEAPYGQPAVYGSALSTDSLLKIAVAKFDSALALPHDSLRFSTLAKIGKARALMSLGRYSDAFQAASSVAPTDVFTLHYTETITPMPNAPIQEAGDAFWTLANVQRTANSGHEIVNREGNNGLTWYVNPAAIDPRVPVTVTVTNNTVYTFPAIVRQTKFVNGTVAFKLASWIEARMVEAEYLLSVGDPNWIAPLNAARATVGLVDTTSPATKTQQVDLLFRERAFWFYGHATRLADMRRLVRQYGRQVNTVFPTGQYTRSAMVYTYGDAVVFIPTTEEFTKNHKYSGCINRNS